MSAVWMSGAATVPASAAAPPDAAFKIYLSASAVYRVTFEELRDAAKGAGVELAPGVASQRLRLTHRGEPVPIWVADGGDGTFDAGDHLELLGERLAGERSYFNEFTELNVYRLTFDAGDGAPPARMTAPELPAGALAELQREAFEVAEHLEEDRLLLRFTVREGEASPEPWYWARLTHADRRPWLLKLDLSEHQPQPDYPLALKVGVRGWSQPPRLRDADGAGPADHRVDVYLNDHLVGSGEWNGQEATVIDVPAVPLEVLANRDNVLRLSVPARPLPDGEDPIVDVVMLNWVELRYPRRRYLEDRQARIELRDPDPLRLMALNTAAKTPLTLFGQNGSRLSPQPAAEVERDGRTAYHFYLPSSERTIYAVPGESFREAAAVELDVPSDLHRESRQADYLMITHPRLRQAIEPLAELHRRNGLTVAVVNVDDVYDEWSDGILDPRAIRDFVSHAYHRWQRPAPRFVLLVGDASWDTKNPEADDSNYADWTYRPGETRRFVKNGSTPYSQTTTLPHRNLVPTWPYESYQGHAASDNYFVTVDGDDALPDLAIGRFPVTEPEEVAAIVAKTARYLDERNDGPWQRSVLWITNEDDGFQRRSDQIAESLEERGFTSVKVYPRPDEPSNEQHQTELRQAFDAGQLLVHFYGHGGRYIWRTGPPDLNKNHDLFTLEDLDDLVPNEKLPVVLSMSCYSAPFDHPTADSIGEKFLRLPDRGAVAVLAASWRNSPGAMFSQALVDELTQPSTIGEAIMRAKQEIKVRTLVEMYNLLGDPAIELPLPADIAPLPDAVAGSAPEPATEPDTDSLGEAP